MKENLKCIILPLRKISGTLKSLIYRDMFAYTLRDPVFLQTLHREKFSNLMYEYNIMPCVLGLVLYRRNKKKYRNYFKSEYCK